MTNKERFLIEHNKLSPFILQADLLLLTQFKKQAKVALFKNDDWSVDKLRRPFIQWLTALPIAKKIEKAKRIKNKDAELFHLYPREED